MHPRMSEKERELFVAFVRNAKHYVEFGCGGSTFVASSLVKHSILSIDSSQEWLDIVTSACSDSGTELRTLHVDIGPVGEWGVPTDPNSKDKWPAYHEKVWEIKGSETADLYMIDGRFRLACLAQVVLHCSPNALICFHDFTSRSGYHPAHKIAREVATAEDLSIFLPLEGAQEPARELLKEYKLNAY
jgi:hypothetical protein